MNTTKKAHAEHKTKRIHSIVLLRHSLFSPKATKLMTLLLVVLVCISANAQVQFGAKAGLDLTNFWGKETNHSLLLNYQAGLLIEYKFHSNFGIAPEVVFAAQGGKSTGKVTVQTDNGKLFADFLCYHMNYINVPVMFKYYTAPDFSIDFGPQMGFNVYSKYTDADEKATDFKRWTNAIDFGLGLGGTYDIDNHVFIQVRYTLGLSKVFKTSYDGAKWDDDRKNGNIQLAFGYNF